MGGDIKMNGEWLTTESNPRRHRTFFGDDGITGWKLHFIPEQQDYPETEYRSHRALCGLRAKYGWGIDLFIEDQCERCARAKTLRKRGSNDRP